MPISAAAAASGQLLPSPTFSSLVSFCLLGVSTGLFSVRLLGVSTHIHPLSARLLTLWVLSFWRLPTLLDNQQQPLLTLVPVIACPVPGHTLPWPDHRGTPYLCWPPHPQRPLLLCCIHECAALCLPVPSHIAAATCCSTSWSPLFPQVSKLAPLKLAPLEGGTKSVQGQHQAPGCFAAAGRFKKMLPHGGHGMPAAAPAAIWMRCKKSLCKNRVLASALAKAQGTTHVVTWTPSTSFSLSMAKALSASGSRDSAPTLVFGRRGLKM